MSGDRGRMRTMQLLPFAAAEDEAASAVCGITAVSARPGPIVGAKPAAVSVEALGISAA